MKKIQVIDFVRTFSILLVMTGHFQKYFLGSVSSNPEIQYLWFKLHANHGYGVSMFFVISGFLITRLIARGPGGLFAPDFRDFYVRRIGRIFPLLVVVCLVGILVPVFAGGASPQMDLCFKGRGTDYDLPLWLSIATFGLSDHLLVSLGLAGGLGGHGLHWDVLWSLQIEEQFYLFYPFLLSRLKDQKHLMVLLTLLIVSCPITIMWVWRTHPYEIAVIGSPLTSFQLLGMGCLLYLLSERWKGYLTAHPRKAQAICLLGLGLFLAAYGHYYVRSDYWWRIFGGSMIGVGTSLFILGGLHLKIFEAKGFTLFNWPGRLSYGMYLLHSTVLFLLWPLFPGRSPFGSILLFAVGTVLIAWVSQRFFEVPTNMAIRSWLGSGRVPGKGLGSRTGPRGRG